MRKDFLINISNSNKDWPTSFLYRIVLYVMLVESNVLYKTSFFYILTTKRKFYSPLSISESLVFFSDESIEAWQFKR